MSEEKTNICDAPEVFRRLGTPVIIAITLLCEFYFIKYTISDFVVHRGESYKISDLFSAGDVITILLIFFLGAFIGQKVLIKLDCYFFNYIDNKENYKKGSQIEEYIVWVKVIIVGLIVGGIVASAIGGFMGFIVGVIVGIIAGLASGLTRER